MLNVWLVSEFVHEDRSEAYQDPPQTFKMGIFKTIVNYFQITLKFEDVDKNNI